MSVRVYVVHQKGRNLVLRYTDPETGEVIARTSGTTNRAEAEKKATLLEKQINDGKFVKGSITSWENFRKRYEEEHVSGLKDSTKQKIKTTLNAFEKYANPNRINGVTISVVQKFLSDLRKKQMPESTIAGYLRHLKGALNWAYEVEMLPQKLRFRKIQRDRKFAGTPMKGRPLTEEEFQRMLDLAPSEQYRFYLRGLWLSGLRLEESLDFWWDREDRMHVYDGMLRIFAEDEKGMRDRFHPITPDFAELLESVPKSERTGLVFKLADPQPCVFTVSKVISSIGTRAGILVNARDRKYASAQDLRRSFGERWAMRVEAAILMQLMRHENITTTLRYYVGRNAKNIMRHLGSTLGNIGQNQLPENNAQDVS